MMQLQLTASRGPAECALAVRHALHYLQQEARNMAVQVTLCAQVPGPRPGTLASVVVQLQGAAALTLAQRWIGTVQWICPSPYRPRHPRKNWFIGVQALAQPEAPSPPQTELSWKGLVFQACKASGPGGQHVNKTASAIRATDPVSGLSVKVQSERSQHANKRLAAAWLRTALAQREEAAQAQHRQAQWAQHEQVQRGGAQRVFVGPDFVLQSTGTKR